MHAETHEFILDCWDRYVDVDRKRQLLYVLEFGSRDVNGQARDAVQRRYRSWTGVDLAEGDGVDVIADAATVELEDRFDVVVCTNVFEHTPSWPEIVQNAYNHLVPRGWFLVSVPGPGFSAHSARYEGPPEPDEWYQNLTPDELRHEAESCGFDVLKCYVGGAWGCETFLVGRKQ